jgi:hypothetical protein
LCRSIENNKWLFLSGIPGKEKPLGCALLKYACSGFTLVADANFNVLSALEIIPILLLSSDSAKNQKNDEDDKNQPYSSAWIVSPVPAMRPPRQNAQEYKDQNHNQQRS